LSLAEYSNNYLTAYLEAATAMDVTTNTEKGLINILMCDEFQNLAIANALTLCVIPPFSGSEMISEANVRVVHRIIIILSLLYCKAG
jgi:hypothetical protein